MLELLDNLLCAFLLQEREEEHLLHLKNISSMTLKKDTKQDQNTFSLFFYILIAIIVFNKVISRQ